MIIKKGEKQKVEESLKIIITHKQKNRICVFVGHYLYLSTTCHLLYQELNLATTHLDHTSSLPKSQNFNRTNELELNISSQYNFLFDKRSF